MGSADTGPKLPGIDSFCSCHVLDIFLGFESRKGHLKNVGAAGVKIVPLPLSRHIDFKTSAICG